MADQTVTPEGASNQAEPMNALDEMANLLMGDESVADTETNEVEETTEDEVTETTDSLDESESDDQETDDVDDSDNDDDVESEEEDQSLAQMLGLDESQVTVDEESGEFLVNTNSKGEHKKVNLKDVIASYQTNAVNTQKSQALAEERKNFDAAVQQRAVEIKQQVEQNNALTGMLQQELLQEYNNTNWDELRQVDPAEYSARQYDFQQKHNRLQNVQNELQVTNQKLAQQEQDETLANNTKLLDEQHGLMVSNNPTWKDQEIMKKDVSAIRTYLSDVHGFSDADMGSLMDSRAITIIQDAMKFRAGSKAVKPKLKAVPKIRKSKGRKVPKLSKLDRLTNAASKATGHSKKKAQDAAIAELFMSG